MPRASSRRNFSRQGDEVSNVIAVGTAWVHFDAMRNHYVPKLTIGHLGCETVRPRAVPPDDGQRLVRPIGGRMSLIRDAVST